MSKEEETLQELIAERKRIDDLIRKYQAKNEVLAPQKENRVLTFEEMLGKSLTENGEGNIDYILDNGTSPRSITLTNINIDHSSRVYNDYSKVSHTNTTVSCGDKVIEALGSILRNLFE